MTVIAGVSVKGAPGVSLGMWGLLHCWPRPVIGMEVDPSGGTWALRHDLTCEPGLASLAATQGPLTFELTAQHAMTLSEHRYAVCAPREETIVSAAMGWLGDRLLAWSTDADLLIDAGRISSQTLSTNAAVKRADTVLLFARPCPEELGPVSHVLAELANVMQATATVKLVLIGSAPYSPDETVEALIRLTENRIALSIGAVLADDPNAAVEVRTGSKRANKIVNRWFGSLAIELAAASAHRPLIQSSLLTSSRVGG